MEVSLYARLNFGTQISVRCLEGVCCIEVSVDGGSTVSCLAVAFYF